MTPKWIIHFFIVLILIYPKLHFAQNKTLTPPPKLSLLEESVLKGDLAQIKELLKARPLSKNPQLQGRTLLFAVMMNNPDAAELLLASGAQPDQKIPPGITPLAVAVEYNQLDLVRIFIKYKADINQKIAKTQLIDLAYQNGYTQLYDTLKIAGAIPTLPLTSHPNTHPPSKKIPPKNKK